jgi:hypothetical protein
MNISDEAVEAAARKLTIDVYGVDLFDGMSDSAQDVLRSRARAELEAAERSVGVNIPDEAVKAAQSVLMIRDGDRFDLVARAALEAAAPYLARAAWDEGKSAGWDAARGEPEESNPYQKEDDA